MGGAGGAGGPLLLPTGGRPPAAGHVSLPAAAVLRVHVSNAALDTLPVCERSAADIAAMFRPSSYMFFAKNALIIEEELCGWHTYKK